jgi:hypothetical protein
MTKEDPVRVLTGRGGSTVDMSATAERLIYWGAFREEEVKRGSFTAVSAAELRDTARRMRGPDLRAARNNLNKRVDKDDYIAFFADQIKTHER